MKRLTNDENKGRFRKLGELKAKAIVASIEDASHQVFLDLAPKITEALLRDGVKAKDILNNLNQLKGVICSRISAGSIIVHFQIFTIVAFREFCHLHESGQLLQLLEESLVSSAILTEFGVPGVHLGVNVDQHELKECRTELEHLHSTLTGIKKVTAVRPMGDFTGCSDDDGDNSAAIYESLCALSTMVTSHHQYAQRAVEMFIDLTSSFLLSLKLNHPTKLKLVTSMHQLTAQFLHWTLPGMAEDGEALRRGPTASSGIPSSLVKDNAAAIPNPSSGIPSSLVKDNAAAIPNLPLVEKPEHDRDGSYNTGHERDNSTKGLEAEKKQQAKPIEEFVKIYLNLRKNAHTLKNYINGLPPALTPVLESVVELIGSLVELVSEKFDFSDLGHSDIAKLALFESLAYRGLVSYLFVIRDSLGKLVNAVNDLDF